MTYNDSHLAAIYDADNPDGEDHDFFRAKATELGARSIVDLGCGTGILTTTLATDDRSVIGIDPAEAMLDIARNRVNGQKVIWKQGTANLVEPASADLVIMSGNVAMHILNEEWNKTLASLSEGLIQGGTLIFETRNPEAQAWKNWTYSGIRDTPLGRLQESVKTTTPDSDSIVIMNCHYKFLEDNYVFHMQQKLQFRSYPQVVEDLQRAGLTVKTSYKNWHRVAFTGGAEQPLMIFVAEKK